MKMILIGNYPGDRLESMSRYLSALQENLVKHNVQTEIILPKPFFAPANRATTTGLLKWLGYVDKYIVFPLFLILKVFRERNRKKKVFFHICDHSNSMYLTILPRQSSGITCHDVLAIQGAFGLKESYCPSTRMGKLLQSWILKNLKKAEFLIAVSNYTMEQLLKLCEIQKDLRPNWKVVHNSFNSEFWPMILTERKKVLKNIRFPNKPFLLHVGSNLPRKNRKLLLHVISLLKNRWDGVVCFAGDPIDKELSKCMGHLNLNDIVISVPKPDHPTLVALYSSCSAFLFPSFSEGFGWPVIEAQACGAPVIASSISSLKETGGDAAYYADPHKPQEFAELVCTLLIQKEERKKMIDRGFKNCKRFDCEYLTREFLDLYE